MADLVHVHFTLSPDSPREKNIIDILDRLPNRQVKSYIMSLMEGQAELPQMAAEVHALAVHFGVGVEVGFNKSTSTVATAQQLPGQVSISDIDDLAPIDTAKNTDAENTAPVVGAEELEEPAVDAAEDTRDMPDEVLGFIGGLNEWE